MSIISYQSSFNEKEVFMSSNRVLKCKGLNFLVAQNSK